MTAPLFARVLGATAFARLPPTLQALHSVQGRQRWRGQACVCRGDHWLVAPCAWLARLPAAADAVPVTVERTAGQMASAASGKGESRAASRSRPALVRAAERYW